MTKRLGPAEDIYIYSFFFLFLFLGPRLFITTLPVFFLPSPPLSSLDRDFALFARSFCSARSETLR